jgi:hypothetical protein
MKGIVIKGGKNIFVHDNVFENLDVAIEAENVTGLWLRGNKIVLKDGRIDKLIKEILGSKISSPQKEILIRELIEAIVLGQRKELSDNRKKAFLEKMGHILGRGAMELVRELLVEIATNKILLITQ